MLSGFSRVWLFVTTWTVAWQAPPSMEFPRQEYWSRLPFLLQGSSRPRDWTHVSCISCIGRQILNYWVAWEALSIYTSLIFYLVGLIIIERSMLQVCFMMVNLSISPWSSFSFGMDLKLFICFFKKSIYWEKIQIYRKAGRIINIHHLDSTLDTFLSCFHFFKKMNYNIVSFYPRHSCMNL